MSTLPTTPPATYLDGQIFAFSRPPPEAAAPRNATVVSIVSGAANKHSLRPSEAITAVVEAAARSPTPVDIVLFPECFLYDGDDAEYCGGDGAHCEGPHVAACADAARAIRAYVVCPIYELATRNASQLTGPFWNTAVLLNRSGDVTGVYRKQYPTSELTPPGGELNEGVLPSTLGVPVFDTDFGRIAVLICWDMEFPEVWHAAASQGAELVLWPSAGHGGMPISGYAQIHNVHIASNGDGQFYDRLGTSIPPEVVFNFTNYTGGSSTRTPPPSHGIPVHIKRVDLDSTVVFYGGPHDKQERYDALIAAENEYGVAELYRDEVAKWSVLGAVRPHATVREALKAACLETRREESTRNRWQINARRAAIP